MRHRHPAVAMTFVAVAMTSTAALGAGQPLDFAQTCLRYEADIETIADTLSRDGWKQDVDADAVITGLIWIGVTDYFTTDTGGETLETILALKAKTAAALVRKKDIPQSKGRFLMRGEDVLYVMWRQPAISITEIECHAALSADTVRDMSLDLDLASRPAFDQGPTEISKDGRVNVTLLNAEKLAPHTPPGAVVQTYHTSRNQ